MLTYKKVPPSPLVKQASVRPVQALCLGLEYRFPPVVGCDDCQEHVSDYNCALEITGKEVRFLKLQSAIHDEVREARRGYLRFGTGGQCLHLHILMMTEEKIGGQGHSSLVRMEDAFGKES